MAQNVIAFPAIQYEVELCVGNRSSQCSEKESPGLAVSGVTVDDDAVHVEDHSL
jgi:hypothetical protein